VVTEKNEPIFNLLALIGFGLIGGSIARAARAQGAARSIVATARSAQTRKRIAELGVVDQVLESNAAAVSGADLVIVCIPVGASGEVAKEIGAHLMKGATVSDVGSVKGAVLRDMAPHLPPHAHLYRPIRLPAPRTPDPTRASPNCSSTAGAS
jgi:cyclohexadieny/prephenate dehydrogenase